MSVVKTSNYISVKFQHPAAIPMQKIIWIITTSQLILLLFRRFTYVTAHSPTLPLLVLRHKLFTYITWRADHGKNILFSNEKRMQSRVYKSYNCVQICGGTFATLVIWFTWNTNVLQINIWNEVGARVQQRRKELSLIKWTYIGWLRCGAHN